MDPVQRIPRYTLMFRTIIKLMAPNDPQRAKLIEADEIASKIAQAEADEETKRAAIMYCLSATVDGFPANLISNSRRFIDCIDVEDVDVPTFSGGSSSNSSSGTLHCTLFLFDDKLVIVKRPGNGDKPGRTLTGLDEIDKLTKAGGLPHGMKKSGMSCKGVVDISDVVATDVGGSGK
jgi:protein ECT2